MLVSVVSAGSKSTQDQRRAEPRLSFYQKTLHQKGTEHGICNMIKSAAHTRLRHVLTVSNELAHTVTQLTGQ